MGQVRPTTIHAARRQRLQSFLEALGLVGLPLDGPSSGFGTLAPVEEALTHTSAGRGRDHEQLEFLGDAVLRLAAAEFLARRHPSLTVGQRSALRAQLVSDRWLSEQAERIDLAAMIHLGPLALADQSGRATVLAECCEALVGALYQVGGGPHGGLELVLRWLEPAWERTSAELLADPDRHNWKTALQEWSQARGLGLPSYRCDEISRRHGDPRRFRARVHCGPEAPDDQQDQRADAQAPPAPNPNGSRVVSGEGWGGSRREAEQQAARAALAEIRRPGGSPTAT